MPIHQPMYLAGVVAYGLMSVIVLYLMLSRWKIVPTHRRSAFHLLSLFVLALASYAMRDYSRALDWPHHPSQRSNLLQWVSSLLMGGTMVINLIIQWVRYRAEDKKMETREPANQSPSIGGKP